MANAYTKIQNWVTSGFLTFLRDATGDLKGVWEEVKGQRGVMGRAPPVEL